MFDDFKELLSALNASKVKYLVVGGKALVSPDHIGRGFRAQPLSQRPAHALAWISNPSANQPRIGTLD